MIYIFQGLRKRIFEREPGADRTELLGYVHLSRSIHARQGKDHGKNCYCQIKETAVK